MFAGRGAELLVLERALAQTKHKNPHHFLLHGERGVGKSSLLLYLDLLARGEIDAFEDGTKYKFLTVNVELDPSIDYSGIVRKIGAEFQRSIASIHRKKEIAKSVWDFVSRWEVMGVKYSAAEKATPQDLLDELTVTIQGAMDALGSAYDGVLVLIDEADKASEAARLGEFCKLFTERLAKRNCTCVALGLSGITGIVEKLRAGHESSPRIFNMLTLEPLKPDERVDVVRRALAVAKDKSGVETKIADEAEQWISDFSEGYPHFIQQFAYCAFEADDDMNITKEDFISGATGENGALQQLGLKYFHELYFQQIWSEDYRAVLRAMSEHGCGWVSNLQIRDATKLKPVTVNNAITALKKRGTILLRPGKKGEYRLPTRSFAAWIRLFTTKAVAPEAAPPSGSLGE